jgi:hypothetical protein
VAVENGRRCRQLCGGGRRVGLCCGIAENQRIRSLVMGIWGC